MTNRARRAVRWGTVPVLAGVAVLTTAAPALAATAGSNSAYGLRATGAIAAGPLAASTYPAGPTSESLTNADIAGLVTAGVVNTSAGPTEAKAETTDPAVTLATATAASLTASAVTASCSFDATTGTVSGSATIAGGEVNLLGIPTTALAGAPAPNTEVSVPGVATITLNRQVTGTNGALTVDAISVTLLGSTQTIVISSVTCQAATLLATPIIAWPFGAGAAGVAAIGGGLWFASRRRHATA